MNSNPKFDSDVETDDTTHAPSGYEKIYYLQMNFLWSVGLAPKQVQR